MRDGGRSCTWWASRDEEGGKDQEGKGREESEGKGEKGGRTRGRRGGMGGGGEGGPAVWGFKDAEFAARKGSVTEAEDRLRGPSVPDAKAAR